MLVDVCANAITAPDATERRPTRGKLRTNPPIQDLFWLLFPISIHLDGAAAPPVHQPCNVVLADDALICYFSTPRLRSDDAALGERSDIGVASLETACCGGPHFLDKRDPLP